MEKLQQQIEALEWQIEQDRKNDNQKDLEIHQSTLNILLKRLSF